MLTRARPEDRGRKAGDELSQRGRARRFACDGGEIYRFEASETEIAERLLALGKAGVGGFVDGAIDDDGVWLVRAEKGDALGAKLREKKPWAPDAAIALGLGIGRALAACEAASLSPGAVTPDTIDMDADRPTLRAEALIGALVGDREASAGRGSIDTVSPLWAPPEQADGAPWDAAANRYALGLVLYRTIAGAHPFAGAGLRHALAEASRREAAPFEEEIAGALPNGLQSLVLRLLDPDKSARPKRAAAIADDLERFLKGEMARTRLPDRARQSKSSGPVESSAPARARPPRPARRAISPIARIQSLWPIALGLGIAIACFALLAPAKAPERPASATPVSGPLDAAHTTAADCASCHARQAAEWRRSVMAHAVKSPLFNALESLIEEQVGRDEDCPNGAGILRRTGGGACRDRASGLTVTGSGGEHWCINCHSPIENIAIAVPPWDGRPGGDAKSRRPARDLLGDRAMEGISCTFCHSVHGPVGKRGSRGYQGNPTWTSFVTGAVFPSRPEDDRGLSGIANSGYDMRLEDLLVGRGTHSIEGSSVDPIVHRRASAGTRAYLDSSEFCGSCHDVRLFGTDALGNSKGEHFKRLRNAYSEWAAWATTEQRAGRSPATCQGCHMSLYPGTCESGDAAAGVDNPECPPGSHFKARAPGELASARVADSSPALRDVVTHYFSGVDVPLAEEFGDALIDEPNLDLHGTPLSAKRRRDLLLRHTFHFAIGSARRAGSGLEIPIEIENTGAGHRVPAGFSQEREFWVQLTVKDGDGRLLYEVGRVDRGDEDLRDKIFERVNTRPDVLDARGRPEGLFGADVRDGPDVPLWQPPPALGGTSFRGKGLINFQNGFLRCVRCIGTIGADGQCLAAPGQEAHRADRFADGDYDIDSGACRSNLSGFNALFETYFPVGALDATRGQLKGPDAIIDTRSIPPNVPLRYAYELSTDGRRGPFHVDARLLFRSFPPFLVKAFAAYEREEARRGARPSGPLVTDDMLKKLEIVELAHVVTEIR